MHVSILLAHAGHAGDHGWLAGALQPLLSLDHLAAALFVAVALSLGLWRLALRAPNGDAARDPGGS